MKLYDNDGFREQFMETVYDLLDSDPDNNRANQIIAAYDGVPAMEVLPVEIPFDKLLTMTRRTVYAVCWDNPSQSGWAELRITQDQDETIAELRFVKRRWCSIRLTRENYRHPWVLCYREPAGSQDHVFVSANQYRRLEADYHALKDELDALKAGHPDRAETV